MALASCSRKIPIDTDHSLRLFDVQQIARLIPTGWTNFTSSKSEAAKPPNTVYMSKESLTEPGLEPETPSVGTKDFGPEILQRSLNDTQFWWHKTMGLVIILVTCLPITGKIRQSRTSLT